MMPSRIRRLLPVAFAAAFVPGTLSAGTTTSGWNACDHIPLEKFVVQSHRGAGFLAEENTLHAFELGWSLGAYPEADVRTTRDGVIVAFHDADFRRVVRNPPPGLSDKGVQDVSFAELSKLEVGRWDGGEFIGHSVPRLADVFAVMRGRPERHLYLDIKDVDLEQLAREVRQHEVDAQVILAAPKPETIRQWKALVPDSATLLWMGGTETALRDRVEALKASNFAGITQVQIHIRLRPGPEGGTPARAAPGPDPFTLSDAFIVELGRELRGRDILYQSLPYTSDPAVYARLLDLGLASFSTDYPEITLHEIHRYYERRGQDAEIPTR